MNDLISRQAAIDIERNATVDTNPSHFEAHQKFTQYMDDAEISSFGRWQWSNGFNTALTAVGIDLKKLPSAQPEQRWIPCSERLPEKGEYGKVLVTYIPSGGTLWTTVIIAHYSDLMGIAKPSFHIGNVGKNDFINITEQVTAWMPLPEPYREERTEE